MKHTFVVAALLCTGLLHGIAQDGSSFDLTLRQRQTSGDDPNMYHLTFKPEVWNPAETAVIVCDMWDKHHCLNATKRGAEMTPRMNAVLKAARGAGALIIHAPSSCMEFYQDHPARKRAMAAPKAANLPDGITDWLNWLDEAEETANYPIDHSDGGEDDEPQAHQDWAEELQAMGRNPKAPWIRQTEGLEIDGEKDAITDHGVENWNLLEQHGIKNVILLGVHLNMCVLGRPFGLRQMAKNGKNVVLMRDLTDTMYNPKMPPYVSHFRGTDLTIEHVEKHVCPTITSDQILGGEPFHFAGDPRKHLVMLIAEQEYKTLETAPKFAETKLAKDFRITVVTAVPDTLNEFESIGAVGSADVLFVSVRRRVLPKAHLQLIRDHVAAGKPMVGIRTASHAFSLRDKEPPAGHEAWESFDAEVWGGNYHGHHGNKIATFAWVDTAGRDHPILNGVSSNEFATGGSLYQVSPLESGTQILLQGRAGDVEPHQPVAWTHATKSGGRVFYTSLGHVDDFKNNNFTKMLTNAVYWAASMPVPRGGISAN